MKAQTDQLTIYTIEYDNPYGDYCVDKYTAANDGQAISLAKSLGNVHRITKDHGRITVYSGR